MLNIKCLQCNMIQENTYIVSDETGEAVVIDCGAYYDSERQAVAGYLKDNALTLRHHLLTHGHFDHVFGSQTLYESLGVRPKLHPDDKKIYDGIDQMCRQILSTPYAGALPPTDDLSEGETICFGSHRLQVIHTPGHTPGGVVFYCEEEQVAFSGDTLFRMSVGRTDLPYGSWNDMMTSLQALAARLPQDTVVYPGHGPKTSVGDEVLMNPYLR